MRLLVLKPINFDILVFTRVMAVVINEFTLDAVIFEEIIIMSE